MIWPPTKAWTSKFSIDGQRHFVAINYGGKLLDRWVILMSVLDSSLVVKVSWIKLVDTFYWECGWSENKPSEIYKLNNNDIELISTSYNYLSADSGLNIPITKKKYQTLV